MSTYSNAVSSIRTAAEARQSELDAVAAKARAHNITTLRALAVEGVPENSPQRAVCDLVAQSLTVGREDGYPSVDFPSEVRNVVLAAVRAGIFDTRTERLHIGKLVFYANFTAFAEQPQCWHDDYNAWDAASDYRKAQSWQSL